MKKYLRRFTHHSDYESYMGGGEALLPNVSVCDDDDSGIVHFNPIEVQPNNEIWYTTTTNETIDPSESYEGVVVVSNEYDGKRCVMRFEDDVTDIQELFDNDGREEDETQLLTVQLPETVEIVNGAFSSCHLLASIKIPKNVISIAEYTFDGCDGLERIEVEEGNTVYDSRDNSNCIIETETNTLIAGCKNTTIPNSITSIGEYAFDGLSSITSINIPNSVTSIEYGAFDYCSNLTSVTIGNSVAYIGGYAFEECTSLTTITIPNSVESIGESVFYNCSGLTSVTIGSGVTSIGEEAFSACYNLEITYAGTRTQWNSIEKAESWDYGYDDEGNAYHIDFVIHFKPADPVELVDLDLPSGTKWMKYNLGSNSETDYGQLYSFGSINPSPARVDSLNSDMVFINEDGDNQLKTDYDAIYQKTDGQARLSNRSEIEELISETNKLFIENYNSSGVDVIKISSKEDDSKYIIIPLNSPEFRYGIGLWSGIAYRKLSENAALAIEIDGDYISYVFSSDESPWIGEYYPLRGVMVPPPMFPVDEYQPDNEIWYKSSDGNVIEQHNMGNILISNTYSSDKGVLLVNTSDNYGYGDYMFTWKEDNENLLAVSFPSTFGPNLSDDWYRLEDCDTIKEITFKTTEPIDFGHREGCVFGENAVKTIYYGGTMENWSKSQGLGSFYTKCQSLKVVHCSDGDIIP